MVSRSRHSLRVGIDREGGEVTIDPNAGAVLIAGSSGIGKSTLATALTERMCERSYEFCVFDPEGDYDDLENALVLGDQKSLPNIDEALKLMRKAGGNLVINTQNLAVADRPAFFSELLPRISELRVRTGRPHWLIIDEAHHLLPASRENLAQVLPEELSASIFVTVHPEAVSIEALKTISVVVALGERAFDVIAGLCRSIGIAVPDPVASPGGREALYWDRGSRDPVKIVTAERPLQAHKRHSRKYAEGELSPERSFYFRGPDKALNLRAQNLMMFVQIADGVDERTWEHHRKGGDYSRWLGRYIKDAALASEAAVIENDIELNTSQARAAIRAAVEKRYTAPTK